MGTGSELLMGKALKKKDKKNVVASADGTTQDTPVSTDPIVIDKVKGLIFQNEEDVYQYFGAEIATLEEEYEALRTPEDIQDQDIPNYEEHLASLFEQPDEVWINRGKFENIDIYTYIRHFNSDGKKFYYVAVSYVDESVPTFIFLHFATQDETLLNDYRTQEKVFSQEDNSQGDALSEGDELAVGLYKAMLTVRAETDIPEGEFSSYLKYRDETVEFADEIWRSTDSQGNVLVSFIKSFEDEQENEVTYITVTLEDNASESHYVMFSFPTKDKNLVDRYRHGETLHTEEVIQEESH